MRQRDVEISVAALTMATGSHDVTAFLRLGGVFTSVMTSNLVFIAIAAVKADASLGERCAVALAGYVSGAAAGSLVAAPEGGASRPGTSRLSVLLCAELFLLVIYALWWVAAGAHPKGWAQLVLVALVAVAMGAQGPVARQLGANGIGTTYLTGTLTGAVSSLSRGRRPDREAMVALGALVAGAAIGVALIEVLPIVVPLFAVAAVGATAALSWHLGSRL